MSDRDDFLFDDDDKGIVPSTDGQISQARDLIRGGNPGRAKTILADVLRQDRNNVRALWMYANLMRAENRNKAITALRRLLDVDPGHSKARNLLDQLEDDALFDDDDSWLSTQSKASIEDRIHITVNPNIEVQGPQMQMQSQTVQQTTVAPMMAPPMPIVDRNGCAYAAGIVAGLFGILGVAHLFNGKILAGLGYVFLVTPIWWAIAGAITVGTGGVGGLCVLPLHLAFVFSNSAEGAKRVRMPVMMGSYGTVAMRQ